jgi:hypothetical protein
MRGRINDYIALEGTIFHERWEFSHKVLEAFDTYCSSKGPCLTPDADFAQCSWQDYASEFQSQDPHFTEILTKIYILKIIGNRDNFLKITRGSNIQCD